jgi:hypothetical protein
MKKLFIFALLPMIANAEFIDGNNLYSKMNSDYQDQAYAMGYITAIADAFSGTAICLPTNARVGQITDVVKQYLYRHPEQRQYTADAIVFTSLKEVWACKKGSLT